MCFTAEILTADQEAFEEPLTVFQAEELQLNLVSGAVGVGVLSKDLGATFAGHR